MAGDIAGNCAFDAILGDGGSSGEL